MILSKKERNKVYRRALEGYIEYPYFGLCLAIQESLISLEICKDRLHPYNPTIMKREFPEIWEQRPENNKEYWWSIEDKKSRINALEKAIKLTDE